jgi:flagellar M-ring protein FliF
VERVLANWAGLAPRGRILLLLAALALLAVLVFLVRLAGAQPMALLYAGLEPRAAAEVLQALEQKGIPHELRGGAIYVPAAARDQARLALAAENLPASGTAGYELLDTLPGFGTTAEMFDATYWRAKEGELARTLLAIPGLRAARVHVANPLRRPFQRDVKPTASVFLTPGPGGLDPAHAEAARYLVASAVAGLGPEAVTVIDAASGLVLRAGDRAPGTVPDPQGRDRAAELKMKLERLLAARVGEGGAIVEVTVETVSESETISERVIDPESRIPIALDKEATAESEEGGTPQGVTVASNLPDPSAADPAGTATRRTAETTRERTNYEVSEVRRERVKLPGEIRRISAAVLVDGIAQPAADGSVALVPRPQAELDQLAELVRSAIGFDGARGDVVTVTSLAFSPVPELGTAAEPDWSDAIAANAATLAQLGLLGLVALGLGLFVLRPMLARTPPAAALPPPQPPPAPALLEGPDALEAAARAQAILDPGPESQARLAQLREALSQRAEESTHLIRSWLDMREPGEDPV